MKLTGALLTVLTLVGCVADPTAVTTTTVMPTTTSTIPPTTTLPPASEEGWVMFGPQGLVRWYDEVLREEGAVGWRTVARDHEGGLAFIDESGLWWLRWGTTEPVLVTPAQGDLLEVIPDADGPIARLDACPSTHIRLRDGSPVADPPAGRVDVQCMRGDHGVSWRAENGLVARITGPGVILDAEDQIVGIEDVAQLEIVEAGVTVLHVPVGGFYEAYARIHDFDGRFVIVSRGPFEPAMPEETYFVIDLATGDTLFPGVAAASSASLIGRDVMSVPAIVAPKHIYAGTPILTDDRVAQLADGRYVGFITHLAEAGLTGGPELHFDLAVWFSGMEAEHAATVDGTEAVPAGYYIRNLDPLELVIPFADEVAVTSVWYHYDERGTIEGGPITFAQLVEAFTGQPVGPQLQMWHDPWWVTIEGGRIVALDEQYVP